MKVLLHNVKKVYAIIEHSTCFSGIPVESGCNAVCVRDSQHVLVRLFQISLDARIVSRPQSIML